jgi:hypothetical protein
MTVGFARQASIAFAGQHNRKGANAMRMPYWIDLSVSNVIRLKLHWFGTGKAALTDHCRKAHRLNKV